MKKSSRVLSLAVAALAGVLLAGCVAYVPYDNGPPARHYRGQGGYGYGDRDGDGVPNRSDRRPDNPRRY